MMALQNALSRLGSAILLFCILKVTSADHEPSIRGLFNLYNHQHGQKLRLVNLKYERCGPESDPGRLEKLEIKATPTGDALVSVAASTDVDVNPPVQVHIEVYKRLFRSWIKLPCLNNLMGSCVIADICQYGFDECPLESLRKANATCHCPIPKGTYSLNKVEIPVPRQRKARMLVGDFKAQVVVKAASSQLACYTGSATVEAVNE